jgi:hypothetical protein
MNTNWKKTAFAIIISCSMLSASMPVWAEEAPAASSSSINEKNYKLTEVLDVQIKSLLNERTTDGTRIGAVVQLKNNGNKVTRVPEYEIRVKTNQGIEYTLTPSAGSARSVQPQSKVEISYMVNVDRQDEIELSELNWIDVDYYVYPKKETPILSVNIEGQVWKGGNASITDQSALKKWSDSFQIASSNSPVTFTPVSIEKDNAGLTSAYIVKLLAENKTAHKEKVPMFLLQGRSETDTFIGVRAENWDITLEPNGQTYLHYRINVEQGTSLASLDVLTMENYVVLGLDNKPEVTTYTVGRFNIVLPTGGVDNRFVEPYKFNTPIVFDPVSKLIHPNVDVSLVEFSIHDSQGVGYQTAIAKFVLTNKSGEAVSTPVFQSELATQDGYSYSGNRQMNAPQQLMPNLSHVVTYSYLLPSSETGENLKLKLLDARANNPVAGQIGYKSTVATLKVANQETATENDVLSFYPFDVSINNWYTQYFVNTQPTITYGYRLKMDIDVTQKDKVVVDQDFSRFEVALVDSNDRILGTSQLSFVDSNNGSGKLRSGLVDITFPNLTTDQYHDDLRVYIYETIQTVNGSAKRLAAILD